MLERTIMNLNQLSEILNPYWVSQNHNSIDVGPGWYHIVSLCHQEIEARNPYYKIVQIKGKFGQLRYYIDQSDPILDKIIAKYETMSSETCEQCGAPGALIINHYKYKTLCSFHSQDFISS